MYHLRLHLKGGGGGRDALEGKGPQRQPQERLGRRLEEVAKAVGGGHCRSQMPLKPALGVREAGHRSGALQEGGFWVWVWVGTLAPYCTSVGRRASFVCSGGLSGSMRPDVHHCCLRDRQVKRMLCSVHPPPPLAVCHLLSHPLSTTQPAVRALGRDYRQLTGLRASVGWAQDAGARPTALLCWLPGLLPPRDSHWACRKGGGGPSPLPIPGGGGDWHAGPFLHPPLREQCSSQASLPLQGLATQEVLWDQHGMAASADHHHISTEDQQKRLGQTKNDFLPLDFQQN